MSFKRRLVSFKPVKALFVALGGLVVFAALAVAGQASAATLSGPWAPFTNCPVNDPAFVNYPHTTYGSSCVAESSLSGSLTIGKTIVQTGSTSLQFGVPGSEAGKSVAGFIVPASDNQTLVAAPAQVPGGLLGLMCPSNVLVVSALCDEAMNNGLNQVTATAELAATPTTFYELNGMSTGAPILTLPIKIQLQNPLLGSSCYIGSDQEPIVLRPETTVRGTLGHVVLDPNGYPVTFLTISGATQGDSTFAVPGTSGCGGALLSPVVDRAINLKQGLPSPAGNNDLVLDQATSTVAYTSSGSGQTILSNAWKASCLAEC